MGTKVQVLRSHDAVQAATGVAAVAAQERPAPHSRHLLLLAWALLVAFPWALQLRSFSALVARHKITDNLLPTTEPVAGKTPNEIAARCPAHFVQVSSVWWTIQPTHYYDEDGVVLCHYVVAQYNTHGIYRMTKTSTGCDHVSYYFYHGSVGYYAFYTEGEGTYCSHDATMYVKTTAVGSVDLNFNALAKDTKVPGYRSSYVFGCIGAVWLSYRALVLTRSFVSCSRYGRRLDALEARISIGNAVIYAQQAARLAPHAATNRHRLVLVYFLLEGLMTDLFLICAYVGVSAKLQYISLGYNIAGLLSMLFEILENSKLLEATMRLLVKRLLFNTELALKGELLFSLLMSYFMSALNRSDLGPTLTTAQAVSYYAWSLTNHLFIVLGHASFILTVRVVGTLAYVQFHYGSLRMLVTPCCVDSVMGYRCKMIKISGYEFYDQRLCYRKETLQAHGMFKVVDGTGSEYLAFQKIDWLATNDDDLSIVGKMAGEHVDSWPESRCDGPVALCDRVLGGVSTQDWIGSSDDLHETESARLINRSIQS